MSNPVQFLDGARGFFRDSSRDNLPSGFVWNLQDYLLLLGLLWKRGGWAYATNDISAVSTGATYVAAVSYNTFTAGTKIVNITDNGKLATSVPGSLTVTAVGTTVANLPPKQSPVQHRQTLVIPSGDGSTASSVKSYDGVSTIATLGGSPPLGQFACVYRDRTVLANSVAQPQRVQFSAAGDPTTWTSTSWIDTTYPITAIWPLRTAILVFSQGFCERLRGTTPPPGTDMSLEPVFEHGCLDARSVAGYGDNVIFANAEGVFLTDGAAAVDLTSKGGIKEFWIDTMASYTTSWSLAGGIFDGKYHLSIMNGGTFVEALVCDLVTRTWTRWTNLKALGFAHAVGTSEEMYFASRTAPRVNSAASCYRPAVAYKNDGDGTAVTPVVETGFIHGRLPGSRSTRPAQGLSTWKNVYGFYDLRDDGGDNPVLVVSYLTRVEGAYTTLTGTLSESSSKVPFKRFVGTKADGLAIKIAQTNASSDTKIYTLSTDHTVREGSRLV